MNALPCLFPGFEVSVRVDATLAKLPGEYMAVCKSLIAGRCMYKVTLEMRLTRLYRTNFVAYVRLYFVRILHICVCTDTNTGWPIVDIPFPVKNLLANEQLQRTPINGTKSTAGCYRFLHSRIEVVSYCDFS